MTVTSSGTAGAAALEARQASLRRQIAIVAALILALSIALAATALFPQPRSAGTWSAAAFATGDSASAAAPHYVELGTYVEPARVDALRERLEQHRFQAPLETRMRVGPFATRGEAQAAQARLSELGFAPGAVVVEKP